MFFSHVGQLSSGVLILDSTIHSAYIPKNTDTIVVTSVSATGNVNLWSEWDNYSQVWKVYCSNSSYSDDIHCMINTI